MSVEEVEEEEEEEEEEEGEGEEEEEEEVAPLDQRSKFEEGHRLSSSGFTIVKALYNLLTRPFQLQYVTLSSCSVSTVFTRASRRRLLAGSVLVVLRWTACAMMRGGWQGGSCMRISHRVQI